MESLEGLSPETFLWIEISIILLAVVVLFFVLKTGFSYSKKRFPQSNLFFVPILIGLFGFAVLYILQRLSWYFEWSLGNYMSSLQKVLIVALLTVFAIGYVKHLLGHLEKRAKAVGISRGKFSVICKLCYFIVYFSSALILFQVFGLSIGPILTFGGIGVAALALAAQDILSNFFGGIMIFFKRPFYEGDSVIIPAVSNFKGTVSEVGLYATILEDDNKRYSYFPNSLFCKSLIINQSRQDQSIILGKVSLKSSTGPQLPLLLRALKEKMNSNIIVSINETIFNDDEIVFRFTLAFEKMPQVAFIEKKHELFDLISALIAPYEGKINLTS